MIYTSGSSGEPKGVVIEHRAIVNRLEWMRQHYGFDTDDRILQKTPATFDVSVWEFFLPLLTGATLVVAPPEAHRDPAWLARIIRAQRIGTCHFVPSMLAAFLAHPDARGLTMRRIFCSGEELPAALRDRLHATLRSELHNLYGPTEAAVDVSWWPAGPDDHSRPVPIGFPTWNTRLYVLDAHMRPVPPDVPGDLYLGGVQLARGYLGREDLTAERFLPDPHRPGQRIYKTGNLARWRAEDGAVVFLGRSDHQVKLRGLRIELGEIEAALLATGLVSRAEVMLRQDAGDGRIVAYVQAAQHAEGTDDLAAALRQRLAARLPDYMVPAAIVPMADWPVTANGKLDRKALPAPAFNGATAGRAPATPTEQTLAALFAEVLRLPPGTVLGTDADFFSLGGDSLSAVQLLLRVEEDCHRSPGLGALFEAPTIAALATAIDSEEVRFDSGLKPLIQLATGDAAQPPLFVIHPAGGIAWGYRGLARAVAGATPSRSVWASSRPRSTRRSRCRTASPRWRKRMRTAWKPCSPKGRCTWPAGRSAASWRKPWRWSCNNAAAPRAWSRCSTPTRPTAGGANPSPRRSRRCARCWPSPATTPKATQNSTRRTSSSPSCAPATAPWATCRRRRCKAWCAW